MSATARLLGFNSPNGQGRLVVAVTFAGNYPAGGDLFDLTPLIGQAGKNGYPFVANNPPYGEDFTTSTGYTISYIPGTTLANGKLKINTTAAAELGAGAYPAGLIADTNVQGELIFDKLL